MHVSIHDTFQHNCPDFGNVSIMYKQIEKWLQVALLNLRETKEVRAITLSFVIIL